MSQSNRPLHEPDPDHIITYTPLNGSGWTTVGEVVGTTRLSSSDATRPGPGWNFQCDSAQGSQSRQPQATLPACAFAEKVGSRLVLSSDPDADRVGVEVRLQDNRWYHFDGNQIAAMLCTT